MLPQGDTPKRQSGKQDYQEERVMRNLSSQLERMLAESNERRGDLSKMSAQAILGLINRRAPEGEFALEDIMSSDDIEALSVNPFVPDVKALSPVIYQAIME